MTRLTWDERPYHEGISQVVLYGDQPHAWNGVESLTTETEIVQTPRHQDGFALPPRTTPGECTGTITSYSFPKDLSDSAVSGQGIRTSNKTFGLSFIEGDYLHLFYNLTMRYEGREEVSLQNDPNVEVFTWNFQGKPVAIPGHAHSCHVAIEMSVAHPDTLMALLNVLYGTDQEEATLPSPADILDMFDVTAKLTITDNGDGTWTATTSEPGIIEMLSPTEFKIGYESAIFINQESYHIRTY